MSRRNPFSRGTRLGAACLKGGISGCCRHHPKAVVLAMTLLLAGAVLGLLLARHLHREARGAPAARLYRQLHASGRQLHATPPYPRHLPELLRLYRAAGRLHPDSLGARDSAFLKEIDHRLNRILYEAP